MWKCMFIFLGLGFPLKSELLMDLSWKNLTNTEYFLKVQHEINVKSVTTLNLQGNKIDSFVDCSTQMDKLEVLDLSQNKLQRFFFACNDEYNLLVLNVSHNKIDNLTKNALNARILKLKVLDLSYNMMTAIHEEMFQDMKNLEFLSLAANPIDGKIDDNAFASLEPLLHLDLKNISASSFSDALFEPLTNLTKLYISWNPIQIIPILPESLQVLDVSGTNVLHPANFILPNLRVYLMNDLQNLSSLNFNAFKNAASLETLSAENCPMLSSLEMSPQDDSLLPELQVLSLRNCALETLPLDARTVMQRATNVSLQDNPWHCDCKLQWIKSFNLTNIAHELRCNTPEPLHHRWLYDIPSSLLKCEFLSSNAHLALWICLAIMMLGVMAASVVLVMKGPLAQWLIRRGRRDVITYTNVAASSNDLNKILGIEDPDCIE